MNDCKTHMWRILVPPSLTSPFLTSVTTATRMKLSPPSSKLLDLYYIEDYYRLVQNGTGTKIFIFGGEMAGKMNLKVGSPSLAMGQNSMHWISLIYRWGAANFKFIFLSHFCAAYKI